MKMIQYLPTQGVVLVDGVRQDAWRYAIENVASDDAIRIVGIIQQGLLAGVPAYRLSAALDEQLRTPISRFSAFEVEKEKWLDIFCVQPSLAAALEWVRQNLTTDVISCPVSLINRETRREISYGLIQVISVLCDGSGAYYVTHRPSDRYWRLHMGKLKWAQEVYRLERKHTEKGRPMLVVTYKLSYGGPLKGRETAIHAKRV